MPDTPADRIAALQDRRGIQVHLTVVDKLDDEDVAMVVQVVE